MVAKLGVVEEEADESQYWLELLEETSLCDPEEAKAIRSEFNEIVRMLVASKRTLRQRIEAQGNQPR
jgi:four helix bundle protein